jgi:DNA-binding response OmpR family regulator
LSEAAADLLVVEDDLDISDMLCAYFRVQGYTVRAALSGEEALDACRANLPDLILLDIRLPDFDGYEVARRLRSARRTQEIPILFLTEKRSRTDRLQGLSLGADDYITKPFDIQELRLRVRNAIRRSFQEKLTSPVTGLPEGPLVDEKLEECLNDKNWSVLRVEICNLDAFRESYGFVACDDVQRAVALMVHNSVREAGTPGDFLGHISPTVLLLFTKPGALDVLKQRLESRLNHSLEYFYPLRERGSLSSRDTLQISIKALTGSGNRVENLEEFKRLLLVE